MEKLVHSVQLNVFEKYVENIPELLDVFHRLLPIDFEKNHLKINHEQLEGFFGIIHSLTLQTTSNHHNILLLDALFSQMMKEDRALLEMQQESRLNDEGVFYIRFDKGLLIRNVFRLTDGGECFHMKIKLAAFPASKERFFSSFKTILKRYT
jgi:RNA binding exosome subunit